MNSHFISFEGIECSGKSTQIKKFSHMLEQDGFTVSLFREPGATELGERIRNILLMEDLNITANAELLLFLSSRSQLIEKEVLPRLQKDKNIVILDRFRESSIAYQGGGRELGENYVEKMHAESPTLKALPNLTFFLDIDLATSQSRMQKRDETRDRMEREDQEFYQRVFKSYQNCLKKDSNRIRRIDASLSQDQVYESIKKTWQDYINGSSL